MTKTAATKAVKATDTNVWVLARHAGGKREFRNAIEAVSAPHMRRCVKAGLVEIVDRTTLRVTDAGVAAIATCWSAQRDGLAVVS